MSKLKKLAVYIAICTHVKFVFVSQPLKSIEHGNSFFSFMRAPKKVIFSTEYNSSNFIFKSVMVYLVSAFPKEGSSTSLGYSETALITLPLPF